MLLDLRRYRLWALIGSLLICTMLAVPHLVRSQQQNQTPPVQIDPSPGYGEFLAWEEVRSIFPRYGRATIIDFDTHLAFRVQRRAGSNHADVQPLTAADTEIMKTIYNGKWSWQRRAVLVELEDGRRLAASMHGMPHGAGAIRGNNYNGHFCIHFRNSITHASRKTDLAHQIMVWKAAGQYEQQIKDLSPEQAIRVFITAVDQGDTWMASYLLGDDEESRLLLSRTCQVDYIRIGSISRREDGSCKMDIRMRYFDEKKETRHTLNVRLFKNDGLWKLEASPLLTCFPKAGTAT